MKVLGSKCKHVPDLEIWWLKEHCTIMRRWLDLQLWLSRAFKFLIQSLVLSFVQSYVQTYFLYRLGTFCYAFGQRRASHE